jgi:hypothetical protein
MTIDPKYCICHHGFYQYVVQYKSVLLCVIIIIIIINDPLALSLYGRKKRSFIRLFSLLPIAGSVCKQQHFIYSQQP